MLAGQVARQPFGLVCVVLLPRLAKRFLQQLDTGMQGLIQALDDVAVIVDLATLIGGSHTEGLADRRAERLRSIDAETNLVHGLGQSRQRQRKRSVEGFSTNRPADILLYGVVLLIEFAVPGA